jgi:hypothetical protein
VARAHLAGDASSTGAAALFLRPALVLALPVLEASSFFLHAGEFFALFVLSYLHTRVREYDDASENVHVHVRVHKCLCVCSNRGARIGVLDTVAAQ